MLRFGESVIVAFIEVKPGCRRSISMLCVHAASAALARYKVP